MKVIFLDIDGVLTTSKTGYDSFDFDSTNLLSWIIRLTGAFIVLSSTWRFGEWSEVLDSIRRGSQRHSRWSRRPARQYSQDNSDIVARIIGRTSGRGGERGAEIDAWLKKNPGVTSFVILDDDSDMEPHSGRLVQTSTEHGLRRRNAEAAIRLLNLPISFHDAACPGPNECGGTFVCCECGDRVGYCLGGDPGDECNECWSRLRKEEKRS